MAFLGLLGFLIIMGAAIGLVSVYSLASQQQALNAIDMNNTVAVFTVTSLTSSATLTAVTPSPIGLLPGTTIYFPSAIGTFTTGTVLSVTASTIVLTGDAPTALTAQSVIAVNSATGQLNGKSFHLFNASISLNASTPLSTLTAAECTFSGYSALTLILTTGAIEAGVPLVQSQLLRWYGTTGAITENVYGWWIDDGTNFLRGGLFATPIGMGAAGSILAVVFQDSFPPGLSVLQVAP